MKHATLSRFASLAASAALALSLAACGSTSRSTYSAAVSNDTAAFSSQDAGDYESYSAGARRSRGRQQFFFRRSDQLDAGSFHGGKQPQDRV